MRTGQETSKDLIFSKACEQFDDQINGAFFPSNFVNGSTVAEKLRQYFYNILTYQGISSACVYWQEQEIEQ